MDLLMPHACGVLFPQPVLQSLQLNMAPTWLPQLPQRAFTTLSLSCHQYGAATAVAIVKDRHRNGVWVKELMLQFRRANPSNWHHVLLCE